MSFEQFKTKNGIRVGKMNGYYAGKVKVVGEDLMCFPARPGDLEPLACGCYDPYAWSDPDPEPVETIGVGEWQRRLSEQWRKTYNPKFSGTACGSAMP